MIIGLAGYARVGKNEAARGLEPLGWEVHAFADKLRQYLYTLNPMVGISFYGDVVTLQAVIDAHGWDGYKETEYNDEIRRLIQTNGTDCGRNLISQDIWVDATLRGYGLNKWHYGELIDANWVIPDVRFPNELDAIHSLGGKVIRISKPGVGPLNDHQSETALDDYRLTDLANDGTIEDLHWKIRHYVEHMI